MGGTEFLRNHPAGTQGPRDSDSEFGIGERPYLSVLCHRGGKSPPRQLHIQPFCPFLRFSSWMHWEPLFKGENNTRPGPSSASHRPLGALLGTCSPAQCKHMRSPVLQQGLDPTKMFQRSSACLRQQSHSGSPRQTRDSEVENEGIRETARAPGCFKNQVDGLLASQ